MRSTLLELLGTRNLIHYCAILMAPANGRIQCPEKRMGTLLVSEPDVGETESWKHLKGLPFGIGRTDEPVGL